MRPICDLSPTADASTLPSSRRVARAAARALDASMPPLSMPPPDEGCETDWHMICPSGPVTRGRMRVPPGPMPPTHYFTCRFHRLASTRRGSSQNSFSVGCQAALMSDGSCRSGADYATTTDFLGVRVSYRGRYRLSPPLSPVVTDQIQCSQPVGLLQQQLPTSRPNS